MDKPPPWLKDDWNEIREALINKIECIVMQYPDSSIDYECPKCHHRVMHETKKPFFIDSIVNFMIEEMKKYQTHANVKIGQLSLALSAVEHNIPIYKKESK